MRARWLGMLFAFIPIIYQLFWLPDWHQEKGRYIVNIGYYLVSIASGIVGATVGLRSVGETRWWKGILRLFVFVGIVLLANSVGEFSGCAVIQRLPDKKDAERPQQQ